MTQSPFPTAGTASTFLANARLCAKEDTPMAHHSYIKNISLIMLVFIAACIETDIYLPAFPDMMEAFDVSEGTIQNLLSWNFASLCLSGPIYGPLSDAFGRRKPLLAGLAIFLLGSIFTVSATSFEGMLLGRVLQGLGAGGCFTIGSAIIFDVFPKKLALRALAQMNVITPCLMAAAPLLGGYLNHRYTFYANFWVITILVCLSLISIMLFFKESLPRPKRTPLDRKVISGNFRTILMCPTFWRLTLMVSLLFAGYIVFLSNASVLFVKAFGLPKTTLPWLQATLILSYVCASLFCAILMEKLGIPYLKRLGLGLIALTAFFLILTYFFFPTNPYWATGAMLPYAAGFFFLQTPYFGELMDLYPSLKGTAASILTSVRLLLTAGIVSLGSLFYNSTLLPVSLLVISIILFVWKNELS